MNIGSGPLRRTVLTLAAVALLSSACVPDDGPTAVNVQFAKGGKGGGPKEDPPPPVYSDIWTEAHDIGYRADDGAWILIASDQSDQSVDPFRVDPDVSGAWGVGPTWTPNGDLLIWDNDGVSVIRQVENGVSSEQLFTVPESHGLPPVWSPDGTMIAFGMVVPGSSGDERPFELFVQPVNSDGLANGELRQVSFEPDRAKFSVRWGPRSKRIATLDDENDEIVIYDVMGGNGSRVLELPGGIHLFQWARTQDRIVTYAGGNVWILDFEGVLIYCNLTSGTSLRAWDPTWSPDDTEVAFGRKHSNRGRNSAAFDLVKVSVQVVGRDGAGCDPDPDWYEETILVAAPDGGGVGLFVQFADWRR